METARVRDVMFAQGAVKLSGSLGVPGQDRRTGAGIVLVGGSGPSDRDNGGYFPPLRQRLMTAGFAVLSYDKRGVGRSTGDWRAATMDDLAADATAALDFLRAQPGIRPGAAGLFGHSEGGWLALRASTARDGLPWVVTNSCPGTSPAVQERFALANHLLELHGEGHPDIDSTLALFDRLTDAGRRDADFLTAAQLVDAAGGPSGLAYYWSGVDEHLWSFLKRKQDHDPTADLVGLRCPHLAFFGGADRAVPVADSVHAFAAAACHPARSPRATLTVEVFPGADHRLQVRDSTRLAPGYHERLACWLADHTGTAR
ncbi:alpha/beta hydrolase [Streptomyces sp. NBC_01166]|uniref:alpha/beta hydrolase family protein n=1 Tax=Streptomyces sp. NBC_01166 TaxID=2903755 RepID=UPI003866C60F|nr:alpha/beta hydrolase [Streptomyces sp. NBC_01166]